MTGGKNFEVARVRRAGDSNKSDEATRVEITSNRIIYGSESAEQREIGAEIRPRVGAANTGEHGGPDAVAGDITQSNDQAAIRKSFPVVIIAAGFIGWLIPTRDGISGDM